MIAVAEVAELQLAVLKGKLHRTEDVEFIMTNRDSAIRARLLAIPARTTRLLIAKLTRTRSASYSTPKFTARSTLWSPTINCLQLTKRRVFDPAFARSSS
jgi:hypothetical protein